MTWWSEHSAVPRFVLANSAIRCRFVDRFVGSRVPSHVSVQRFSTHGAPLSSAGSRRARFPAIKGHTEALRLPARAFPLPYGFGHGAHALLLRSCSPKRSRPARRSPSGLEQFMGRRSQFRLVAPVDASGTSQVPWRSVPCLCPAPGPRSSRRDLASGGLLDAAPGFHKPKASTGRKISRLTQGFSIRCLRFTSDVAATHARTRFRLAGCASTGRASNPLDRYERFQVTFPSPFPGLSLSQVESSRKSTLRLVASTWPIWQLAFATKRPILSLRSRTARPIVYLRNLLI